MQNTVSCRAIFTGCTIGKKVTMKFELDGESRGCLPALSLMTGSPCELKLSSDQQVLAVDRATGELLDDTDADTPMIDL